MTQETFEKHDKSIFSPIKIGNLELTNRLVMAPMAVHLTPTTGELNELTERYFLERAKGGVGLIMVPGTGWTRIDAAHPTVSYGQVPFYKEERKEGHRRLVAALKETGVKVGIQLNHRGRQAPDKFFDHSPVGPSPIPWSPRAKTPQVLSIAEIENLIERYGKAAANAKEVGFDLVEVHGAHGYLISNFLSPNSNQRQDEYGGDFKGRTKFLLEIVKRIKDEVGSNFTISVRINGSDFVKGGLTIEDSIKVASLLEASGVDLISVSAGVNGSYPLTIAPFYTEKACFISLSEEIKRVVTIPVLVTGRIDELELAQSILRQEKADLIGIGRPLLADPHLPLMWMESRENDVRKCIGCNYCIDAYWKGEGGCAVNPDMGREKEFEIKPVEKSKDIWVIGAGLAGMEAAWRAAMRGHSVSLFEEEKEMGGQWILASTPPFKKHFLSLLDSLSHKLKRSGVKIFLGKKIDEQAVQQGNPDVVIIATGAEPEALTIDGLKEREQISAWDVLKGNIPSGEDILVIGGGAVGLEVAHLLVEKGKKTDHLRNAGKFWIRNGRYHQVEPLASS